MTHHITMNKVVIAIDVETIVQPHPFDDGFVADTAVLAAIKRLYTAGFALALWYPMGYGLDDQGHTALDLLSEKGVKVMGVVDKDGVTGCPYPSYYIGPRCLYSEVGSNWNDIVLEISKAFPDGTTY